MPVADTIRIAPRSGGGWLVAEWLLTVPVISSLIWVAAWLRWHHYLPQPFVYDSSDTFMDWFNVAAYANRSGAYDYWHAVYPPISFVFLRLFSLHSCYGVAFNARDCDWLGQVTIGVFYVIDCLYAWIVFRRLNHRTAIPRAIAFGLGLPLLFCLERGNLILVCLPAFMYAYGGLARSRVLKGLAIAITINFKTYLLLIPLALGLKRDWRALEAVALITLAVYLATLGLFGSGDPIQIVQNLGVFIGVVNDQFWNQIYSGTSYMPLITIRSSGFPILSYMSSDTVTFFEMRLPIIIHMTQAIALIGLGASWLQPRAIPLARIGALIATAHLVTQSLPLYSLIFPIFLVFLKQERRAGLTITLICAYLLSITYDEMVATVIQSDGFSWISGQTVSSAFGLAIGQFVRPGLIIVMVWSIAFDIITQVAIAHRGTRPVLGLAPA